MAGDDGFIEHLKELFEPFGSIVFRRMFGGHGIFREGLMFGLVADSMLYLKADDENRERFDARGLGPFTYTSNRGEFSMSYYRAPEEALENSRDLDPWALSAFQAARRAAAKKPVKKKTGKKQKSADETAQKSAKVPKTKITKKKTVKKKTVKKAAKKKTEKAKVAKKVAKKAAKKKTAKLTKKSPAKKAVKKATKKAGKTTTKKTAKKSSRKKK